MNFRSNPYRPVYQILLLALALLFSSGLCNKSSNVDTNSEEYKTLDRVQFIDIDIQFNGDLSNGLFKGSWNEFATTGSMTGFSWRGNEEFLTRSNCSLEGNTLHFDARRDFEDEYQNIESFWVDVEVIFSDDFQLIEKLTASWEGERKRLGEGSHFDTQLKLKSIPLLTIVPVDYYQPDEDHGFYIQYQFGPESSSLDPKPESVITQDQIDYFYSSGDYYWSYWTNPTGITSIWNISGIDIPEDNDKKPVFTITFHNWL